MKLLLVVLYMLLIAAGLFAWEELFWACWGLVLFFLLSYALCKRYYEARI